VRQGGEDSYRRSSLALESLEAPREEEEEEEEEGGSGMPVVGYTHHRGSSSLAARGQRRSEAIRVQEGG
jgi:hypothetical protein